MIDYGIDIKEYIECLPDTLYVENIEYGERKTKNGIYLAPEKMDYLGEFIRPRWAKVLWKSDTIKNINIGDYILISYGMWSTSILLNINGIKKKVWFVGKKAYDKKSILAVSKTKPKIYDEYINIE